MKIKVQNKFYKILFIILCLILVCVSFDFYLDGDENFTIGLIHNTYGNLINLDSLDVHPPLYYLLLKLFLQITTFWTNDIFIKIFLARIFSLISYIILIYFGIKLLKLTGSKFNQIPIYVIYLAMPSILLYAQYIRMYILAAMFLIIELYELIKYVKDYKYTNLILAVIMASLAAYTHYFAAISAGLFLFYFFVKMFIKKGYKISFDIAASGIIYLIFYIPWMIIAKSQFSMATSSKYSTNQIYTKATYTVKNLKHLIEQTVLSLVGGQGTYGTSIMKIISVLLLAVFIYLIYWSYRNLNNKFNSILYISGVNLLGTVFVGLLISIIKHPILIDHYLFPSFAIFSFFMSYVIYRYLERGYKLNKIHICFSTLIVVLLFVNVSLYAKHSVGNLIKSHAIITQMYNWNRQNCKSVYMKNTKKNIWKISNNSIYLGSMHKVIKTNNLKNTDQMFGRPDVKLMHGVYPNVKD